MARIDLVSDQLGGATIARTPNAFGDDTQTIQDAIAKRKMLQQGTYYYKGGGEDVQWVGLEGRGSDHTTVVLPDGVWLFTPTQVINQTLIRDINFVGGAGVLRGTWAGTNVTNPHVVTGCRFKDFTVCAIAHNSLDMPYWHIEKCVFWPANNTQSVCIALSGLTDKSVISGCKFLDFKVGVKLTSRFRWVTNAQGQQVMEWHNPANISIDNNDFIHFATGTERVAVWLVPAGDRTDACLGVAILDNKFGPEYLDPTDFRVIVADEGSGTHPGDRLPQFGPSQGYAIGVRVVGNSINSPGDQAVPTPIIFFTPNALSWEVHDNHLGGAVPNALIDWWYCEPTTETGTVVGDHTVNYPGLTPVLATAKGATVKVTDTTGNIVTVMGQREFPAGWPNPTPRAVNPGAAKVTMSHNGDTLLHPRSEGVVVALGTASDGLAYVSGAGKAVQGDWNGNPVIWPGTANGYIGWPPYIVRANVTGPWLHFAGHSHGDFSVLIKIDGTPLWDKPRVLPAGTYEGWMGGILLEFPDSRARTVEIQTSWPAASLNTATGGTIKPAPDSRPKVLLVGDSWTEGTDQGGPWQSYSHVVQATAPWDVSIQGQGGTGYTVGAGDSGHKPWTDASRLNVIADWQPDLAVLYGSINDAQADPAAVGSALTTILDDVQTRSPGTKVLIVGPQLTDANNVPNLDQMRSIYRNRPEQVIAVIDPTSSGWTVDGLRGDGSAANPDGVHPTSAGVEWLAYRMIQAIRAAGGKAGIDSL